MGYTESYACGVQIRPHSEARETEAGITEEGCVLKEAHGFSRREYHNVSFTPGDKLEILPTHCCTTVNLHDRYYGIRNEIVESVWDIAARGRSQ